MLFLRLLPMNIDVAKRDFVKDIDCHTCVKCVDACPVDDALNLKINLPKSKKQKSSKKETKKRA